MAAAHRQHRGGGRGRALALFLAAAAARGGGGTQDVFLVDGMAVDPLTPTPVRPLVTAPELTVKVGSRLSKLPPTIEAPPATAAEAALAGRHLERAQAYLRTNDIAKALLEVRDGLSYNPDDPRLLSLAGSLSAQRGDYQSAASFLRRFMERNPGDGQHAAALIAVLLRLSRFDEAEQTLRAAEALHPDFLPLHFHRACLRLIRDDPLPPTPYWSRRSFDEMRTLSTWLAGDRTELARMTGKESFARLCDLTLGPGTAAAIDEIANCFVEADAARRRNEPAAALELLRRAETRGVRGFGLDAGIAETLELTGDIDGAVARWADIARRHPDWSQPWLSYGHVLIRCARFNEALIAAKRAKELEPDQPVVDFLLACALAHQGAIADAQRIFNTLTLTRPRDFRRWLESDAAFEAALEKMPNRAAILRNLEIPPEMEQ